MMKLSAISDETIKDEFEGLGISISKAELIDKCKELCLTYQVNPADLVTEWVAFALNKSIHSITIEALHSFEKEFERDKTPKPSRAPGGVTKSYLREISLNESFQNENDILSSYGGSPQSSKKRSSPPQTPINKKTAFVGATAGLLFSPASFSPTATPSRKYSVRSGKGEVILSYGTKTSTTLSKNDTVKIDVLKKFNTTKPFRYMYQKLVDKASVLDLAIDDLADFIKQRYNIENVHPVCFPSQDEVTVIGRICCDSNGKLNAKSILLESSNKYSGGKTIPIDVQKLQEYCFFPGQIVAMSGVNSSGKLFCVNRLYEPVFPPSYPAPESFGPLSILVAAGPFTTTDSLNYEPLADFMQVVRLEEPDVCILLGPFVDSKHKDIADLKETFEEFFDKQLASIIAATAQTKTHLVIVPSYRDVHHHYIYPQPPFSTPLQKLISDRERVHFVTDPCMLNINGIIVAMTSTDILFQLGTEEAAATSSTDRLARLASHLFSQQSLYPLYPSNDEVLVDYEQCEWFAKVSNIPHILITPSDFRYFAKNIQQCCTVNPGRLTKGEVAGSFARIIVEPKSEDASKAVIDHMYVEVVKI